MSLTARHAARAEAKGLTTEELRQRIAEAEAAPQWKGVEFDDARMRHMAWTRLKTLRQILEAREARDGGGNQQVTAKKLSQILDAHLLFDIDEEERRDKIVERIIRDLTNRGVLVLNEEEGS